MCAGRVFARSDIQLKKGLPLPEFERLNGTE
jgi:hypothetical protein